MLRILTSSVYKIKTQSREALAATLNEILQKCSWRVFALCGLCSIFFMSVSNAAIVGYDARFAVILNEFLQHHFSWVPKVEGVPYPDYPILGPLLTYLFSNFNTQATLFALTTPFKFIASFSVLLTYLIAARVDKHWGWLAALLLLTSWEFIEAAQHVSLDLIVMLVILLGVYVIEGYASRKILSWNWRCLTALFMLLGLGFFARGPIGFFMPAAVFMVALWIYSYENSINWFLPVKILLFFGLSFIFLVSLQFAMDASVGGSELIKLSIMRQVLMRLQDKRVSVGYYFKNSLGLYALAFPLALIFLGSIAKKFIREESQTFLNKSLWVYILWFLIIFIGMCIPADKKIRYLLPMLPACALLGSRLFLENISMAKILFPIVFSLLIIQHLIVLPIQYHLSNSTLFSYKIQQVLEQEMKKGNKPLLCFYNKKPDQESLLILANLPFPVTTCYISVISSDKLKSGSLVVATGSDLKKLSSTAPLQTLFRGQWGHQQGIVLKNIRI